MIFILSVFISLNACSQKKDPVSVIESFINDAMINQKKDSLTLNKYLESYNLTEDNKSNINLISYFIDLGKEEFQDRSYKIIPYSDIKPGSNLQDQKLFTDLEYDSKENLFYAIDKEKNEIITFFVFKNSKIISFFPYMHKGSTKIVPYELDKKPDYNKNPY